MKTNLFKTAKTVLITLLVTVLFVLFNSYNGFAQANADEQDLAYEWSETTNNASAILVESETPNPPAEQNSEGPITFTAMAGTTATISAGSTICSGSSVSISFTTSSVWTSGYTGTAQYFDGTSWVNMTANTTNTYSFTPSVTTTYYSRVLNYNGTVAVTSAACTITVNTTPGATSVSGAGTFCNSTTITGVGPCSGANTIGTGTTTQAYAPLYGYYNYSRSASLILRSEMTGSPGLITHLAVYVGTAGSHAFTGISIRLKKTTATTAPTTFPGDGTQVWTGSYTFSSTGWVTFDITDFNWDSDNLLIEWQHGFTGYTSAYPYFQYTTTAANLETYGYSDSGLPTTGTNTTSRPNYQLTFAASTIYWQGTTSNGTSTATTTNPQTVTSSGTYYYRARNDAGCWGAQGSATVQIDAYSDAGTVTQSPANGGTVCTGNNVTYTQSGGTGTFNYFEYQWNGTGGAWSGSWITTNPGNWTSGLNGSSVLYVRAVKKNGVCPAAVSSPVSVTVQSTDNNAGAISVPTSICQGTPTNIANVTVATTGTPASSGPNYYFYYRGGPSNISWQMYDGPTTNSSSALPAAVINTPGTWYVARNSQFGCTGQANNASTIDIPITVNPNVSITSATATVSPICANSTTTITANGVAGTGATLTWWTGAGGTGSNLGSANPLTVNPGTYYARVTGTCGSPVESSVTVVSTAIPAISSVTAAANPICANATTTLTANGVGGGGATVTWYAGAGGTGTNYGTGTTKVVSPGTYYARVTGTCTPAVEASITVNSTAIPAITSVTAAANPICANATTTLTANGVAGAGATVTWYSGAGGTGTNYSTGATLANAVPGTYYARVTGTCTPAVEASITVNSTAIPTITSVTAAANPICANATTTLTANGVAGTGATVTWYSGAGGTGTNYGTGTTKVLGPGTYYARVTGTCTPAVEASITITGNTVSAGGSIAGATSVCTGTNSATLTLSGNIGSITKWQYSTDNWVTPIDIANTSTSQNATNLTATTKYRAVITSGVCPSANSTDAAVTVVAQPSASSISVSTTSPVCIGTLLNASLPGGSGGVGTTANIYEYTIDGLNFNPYTSGTNFNAPTVGTTMIGFRTSRTATGSGCVTSAYNYSWLTVKGPLTTGLSTNDYVWTGVIDASDGSNRHNWCQFNGTTMVVPTSAPTSGSTGIVYIKDRNGCGSAPVLTSASSRDLLIETGQTLSVANGGNLNIAGNFTNNGTFTSGTGTVTLNGTTAQSLSGTGSFAFNNLTLNNTGTNGTNNLITPSKAISVNGTLTMTNGILVSTPTNLLTMNAGSSSTAGTSTSFVQGPVKKIGNTAFTFPVGDIQGSNIVWAPIGISAPSLVTDAFTATYSFTAPPAPWNPGCMTDTLDHASGKENWDLARTTGSSNVFLTLYFKDLTRSQITAPGKLRVVHWNSTSQKWENLGIAQYIDDGGGTGHIVSKVAASSFSPFTFGAKNDGGNPLPVELTEFKGLCKGDTRELIWKTATETNNDYFTLESSKNGIDWTIVTTIPGSGNSNIEKTYSYSDASSESVLYYRLKQTDFNGQNKTFNPITVSCTDMKDKNISIFPNPFQSLISVSLYNISDENIVVNIYDMYGKLIEKSTYRISNGFNNMVTLDMGDMPSGVYYLEVKATNYVKSTKIIKNK